MNNPKQTRITLGLSQSEMAQVCRTHPMTVSKWETGERKPRGQAVRLLEILGILKSDFPRVYEYILTKFVTRPDGRKGGE